MTGGHFSTGDREARMAATLGVWAALAAAFLALSFGVLMVAIPSAPWAGIDAYARAFTPLQLASMVPALLLTPTTIVVMACLHIWVVPPQRLWTLIGLTFSAVYAAIIAANYFLQLHTLNLSLQNGQLEGLALLALPNFHSAFFALEAIGYGFQSLATIAISPLFSGGRLENWIRRLLLLNGALGVLGVAVAPFDRPLIILAGAGLWSLVFPAAMILIAILFRRSGQA